MLAEGVAELNGHASLLKLRFDRGIKNWQHLSSLSAKIRERLDQIGGKLSDLAALASEIDKAVDDLNRDWHFRIWPKDDKPFSKEEIAALRRLNKRLSGLERHLVEVAREIEPPLKGKTADPNDRMVDYEMEATLRFTLREDDAEYDDAEDNFLTIRKMDIKNVAQDECMDSDIDFCESRMKGMVSFEGERHCYLFHDLYDHGYRLSSPRVSLRDCLRIGSVWTDVVIYRQYSLNIDTGEWEKWHSPEAH